MVKEGHGKRHFELRIDQTRAPKEEEEAVEETMESVSLFHKYPSAAAPYLTSKLPHQLKRRCSSRLLFAADESGRSRRLVVVAARKKPQETRKPKSDSYVVRPDESTGPFPEAVLLKQVSKSYSIWIPKTLFKLNLRLLLVIFIVDNL